MTKLIGFAGRSGSGKDTAAFLVSGLCAPTVRIRKLSFASPIKYGLVELFGFPDVSYFEDRVKKETVHIEYSNKTPRQLMQWMGSDIFRNQVSDRHWNQIMRRKIETIMKNHTADLIMVTDVRFPDEVELIKELGGRVFYIDSDQRNNLHSKGTHISETIVEQTKSMCTEIIDNNKTMLDTQDQLKKANII